MVVVDLTALPRAAAVAVIDLDAEDVASRVAVEDDAIEVVNVRRAPRRAAVPIDRAPDVQLLSAVDRAPDVQLLSAVDRAPDVQLLSAVDRAPDVQLLSAAEASKITPSMRAQNRELKRRLEEMSRLQAHVPVVPAYWRVRDISEVHVSRFDVPFDSAEGLALLEQFESGGMSPSKVHRIERIENMNLWIKFCQRKREMERELNGGLALNGDVQPTSDVCNEAYWFHGAAPCAIQEIIQHGFDTRVSNLNGLLGAGAYFASRASYSHEYASRPAHSAEDVQAPRAAFVPHQRGKRRKGRSAAMAVAAVPPRCAPLPGSERQMLRVRVLQGKVGTGAPGQRRPTAGTHSAWTPDTTMCGVPQRLLCIYDHHQAYPEYCISYSP